MMHISPRRHGGALLLVLLFMFIIDTLVLGTLHLAMLERRLAENATAALRLQLAARSAAATALTPWHARLDSLAADPPGIISVTAHSADGLHLATHIEALAGGILMVRAEAREMPPRYGASHAATLWLPPALPAHRDAAAAALSANVVQLENDGIVSAMAADSCAAGAAIRAAVPPVAGSGTVQGAVDLLPAEASLTRYLPALLARAAAVAVPRLLALHGDSTITHDFDGVVIASRTLVIANEAVIRGLVIAGEALFVEAGASIIGSAHVGGTAHVAGSLHLDSCRVMAALEATGLARTLPLPQRHVLPGF
jgi:hypothetical protein